MSSPGHVAKAASLATTRLPQLAWLPALREPHQALGWDLPQWELVLRLARRLRLLGRLAESLSAAGLMHVVPEAPARLLLAEQQFSRWRTVGLRWALERLPGMMKGLDAPLVLLKGGAYIGQELPIAAGRLPSDIDIMVPASHIERAQALLQAAGWSEGDLDEHDSRYYREWSHELPPMRHMQHGLELDLHHNILPPVARTRVDAELLFARLQPCALEPWQVLHPHDQVLHSASHLFHDSEARDRVRDLVDLDGLLRHFATDPDFWPGLPARAVQLGLAEPLALACHFLVQWLQTPIPPKVLALIRLAGPSPMRRAWLHLLMASILTPTHPDLRPAASQALAAQVLLVRYHYGRMPLRLLMPHLWHKFLVARRTASVDAAAAAAQRA